MGTPNDLSECVCGRDETSNESNTRGDDLSIRGVRSEGGEQSQNTDDCGPHFYLCSSLKRRFSEVPTFLGHLADGAPFAEHGSAMDREKYADNAES